MDGREEHIAVFEHSQDSQVEDDANSKDGLFTGRALRLCFVKSSLFAQCQTAYICRQRTRCHQACILDVPRHVEHVAADQQPDDAQFSRYHKIDRADGREEEHELYRVELHRLGWLSRLRFGYLLRSLDWDSFFFRLSCNHCDNLSNCPNDHRNEQREHRRRISGHQKPECGHH